MAVQTADVREGDPTVQENTGQHRGTVDVTFTDGRVLSINIRAADQDEWNDKVAAVQAEAQARMTQSDAEAAVNPDAEVQADKEATLADVAVAYLRRAWNQEQAYDAYLLFSRFNNYRLNQGWTLDQVQTNLQAAGLTVDEWDEMRTAYTYLNGAGRPAIMADNRTIQSNWEAR